MRREFAKLPALLLVLGMILPPGCCCGMFSARFAVAAKSAMAAKPAAAMGHRACCQRNAEHRPQAPESPVPKCQCVADAAPLPETFVPASDAASQAAVLPVALPGHGGVATDWCSLTTAADLNPGPPVRVLLCVWLC